MSTELIGYMAGAIVAVSLSPQIIKSWRSKSTKDISIAWTLTYLVGLSLWVTYGVQIGSYPLMIMPAIEWLMAFSLLVLKLIYK